MEEVVVVVILLLWVFGSLADLGGCDGDDGSGTVCRDWIRFWFWLFVNFVRTVLIYMFI